MQLIKHLFVASWKLHTFTIATNLFAWWFTYHTIRLPQWFNDWNGSGDVKFSPGETLFWTILTGLLSLTFVVYDLWKFRHPK